MSTQEWCQRIRDAADELRRRGIAALNPVAIETLAEVVGIDVNAPFSYREMCEMADAAAGSVDMERITIDGERRYYPHG